MDFEKNFLPEDFPQLNKLLSTIQSDLLASLELSLSGRPEEAEIRGFNALNCIAGIRVLHQKKLDKDQEDNKAMAVRQNYF